MNSTKSKYIAIIIAIGATISLGCHSVSDSHDDKTSGDVVEIRLQGPLKSDAELAPLKKKAKAGDAQAAFDLSTYYQLVAFDGRLGEKYFKLAVKLEHPTALFLAAYDEWTERHPNIKYVEKMVKRSIELGYKDEHVFKLHKEVEEAKKTGIIPDETGFRHFGDYDHPVKK